MKSSLKKAISTFRKNKLFILLSVVIDLVLFYIVGKLHIDALTKTSGRVEELSAAINEAGVENLMFSQSFLDPYHAMISYFTIFLLGSFVAFMILQGINWMIAHYVVERKLHLKYLARFAGFSLLWFGLFMLILFVFVSLTKASNIMPFVNASENVYAGAFLMLVLGYFAVVSYALPYLMSIKIAVQQYKLFTFYLGSIALTTLLMYLGWRGILLHWSTLLIIMLLIIMPLFFFYKIFFIIELKKFTPKNIRKQKGFFRRKIQKFMKR